VISTKFSTSSYCCFNEVKVNNNNNYKLAAENVNRDLKNMHADIRKLFTTNKPELKQICDYFFDGTGKSIRPLILCTISRALNIHYYKSKDPNFKIEKEKLFLNSQRQIALIAEMIHVASLIHDDIIDNSDLRRGKASINSQWGCHKAVLAGDYVLAVASKALAQLENNKVVESISLILDDLVKGELMQFGAKELENERFEHYSTKTYRKTASLIANSCKSVAILLVDPSGLNKFSQKDLDIINLAFEFGKNIGIAFQLIDDVLDFTQHSDKLGKPGFGADLRLGLATAPVLFAASEYPQLNPMIMRRFSYEGDVTKAFEFVMKSSGIKETRYLASKYCENAEKLINKLYSSEEVDYLRFLIKNVINREK
jgi:decaprenyl-diphosphate synthase subunit 1